MSRYDLHVFVCTNERAEGAPRPSCGRRGGHEIVTALKAAVSAHPELLGKVRINKAGCLDWCDEGPALVVYPEACWYQGVAPADAVEIVGQHLLAGKPVGRLKAKAF